MSSRKIVFFLCAFIISGCSTVWVGYSDYVGAFTRARWEKELPLIKEDADELLLSFIENTNCTDLDPSTMIICLVFRYHWRSVTLTMLASDSFVAPAHITLEGARSVGNIPVLYYTNDNHLRQLSKEENDPRLLWQILSKDPDGKCRRAQILKKYEREPGRSFTQITSSAAVK